MYLSKMNYGKPRRRVGRSALVLLSSALVIFLARCHDTVGKPHPEIDLIVVSFNIMTFKERKLARSFQRTQLTLVSLVLLETNLGFLLLENCPPF